MGKSCVHFWKVSRMLFCVIVMSFLTVSCLEKDVYQGHDEDSKESELNGFFDFPTTKVVDLNVKYDLPQGYDVLFGVYDANPLSLSKGGQVVLNESAALAVRSTDKGRFSGKISIPASTNEIYIYSSEAGVPVLLKADLTGTSVSLTEADRVNMEEGAVTRAATYPNAKKVSDHGAFLTLGSDNTITWEPLGGKPLNVDASETAEFKQIQASVLTAVNAVLREGSEPSDLVIGGNDYRTDLVTKDAKVYLRYVCGKSSSMGTLAYYCYPADVSLTKKYIESLPKALVFANTLDESWDANNSSLERGTCIQLKYINPQGKIMDEFPKGTRIGFVLYNNGYRKEIGADNRNFNTKYPFYSTPVPNGGEQFGHTASFTYTDDGHDMILVGFEDWTDDNDYNDFVFNVTGVEGTNFREDKIVTIAGDVTRGTLAFEDNWPNEGDYDMNDVIVKYKSETYYKRTTYLGTSKVEYSKEKVNDTYELVWTGASYKNGFGYKVDAGDDITSISVSRENKKVSDPTIETEPDGAKVIILFTNAKKELGIENVSPEDMVGMSIKKVTFTVETAYNEEITSGQIPVFKDKAPYNPFVLTAGKRSHEIHLIDKAATSKMNTKLWGTGNDVSNPNLGQYYHNKIYWPFAINVDASGNNQDAWSIADKLSQHEGVRIDNSYPNFVKWANSKGTQFTTWWK